ncbi:hypothetical protein FQN57_005374 [Myotisia sp. PD_48]|nr:hypothetical protein FQN57_005374 [Myotisia sp. PD_48]
MEVSTPMKKISDALLDKSTGSPAVEEKPVSSVHSAKVSSTREEAEPAFQPLIFTDPVAFRYLEEDQCTIVLNRQLILSGYQIYIVEQWACSRGHPTFVINTYTGDSSHVAHASVLSVPVDENKWSPRLKTYFDAVAQFHARKRPTSHGVLMVTNLSSFPSSLAVIPVPDGNVRLYREGFIVNENLKRLGCSGRAGLNLKPPAADTEAKFYRLYKTYDQNRFYTAVQELVRLCQLALVMFDQLAPEYADGLLCDVTEQAINDWWTAIGTDLFNIEPSDGILGPTTVSALLGTFMGARNRLHAWGAPVPKDPFDITALKKGVGSFQKAHRLSRTRRIDWQTLDKLHRATAKAASGDGWAVPRAVKSTVAELGGKGGEMVMGIVGGRDKAGISDVETLDIDRFIQFVSGDRSKWLWRGKPQKAPNETIRHDAGGDETVFTQDDRGGYVWARRKRDLANDHTPGRTSLDTDSPLKYIESPVAIDDKEQQPKSTLKKSVTSKVSDARAGLGRFRDAVGISGRRYHHHRFSKENTDLDNLPLRPSMEEPMGYPSTKDNFDSTHQLQSAPSSDFGNNRLDLLKEQGIPIAVDSDIPLSPEDGSQKPTIPPEEDTEHLGEISNEGRDSTAGQTLPEVPTLKETIQPSGPVMVTRMLRRAQSYTELIMPEITEQPKNARLPRHLSFSAVDDSILTWKDISDGNVPEMNKGLAPADAILIEEMISSDVRAVEKKISDLAGPTTRWVEQQISDVEAIEHTAQDRAKEISASYELKLTEYQNLRIASRELISQENAAITDSIKQIEMLEAKLDYELDVLQSRIEEAEDGLLEYERQIVTLEERVQFVMEEETKNANTSWIGWTSQFFRRSD